MNTDAAALSDKQTDRHRQRDRETGRQRDRQTDESCNWPDPNSVELSSCNNSAPTNTRNYATRYWRQFASWGSLLGDTTPKICFLKLLYNHVVKPKFQTFLRSEVMVHYVSFCEVTWSLNSCTVPVYIVLRCQRTRRDSAPANIWLCHVVYSSVFRGTLGRTVIFLCKKLCLQHLCFTFSPPEHRNLMHPFTKTLVP